MRSTPDRRLEAIPSNSVRIMKSHVVQDIVKIISTDSCFRREDRKSGRPPLIKRRNSNHESRSRPVVDAIPLNHVNSPKIIGSIEKCGTFGDIMALREINAY
jgi:hypothetical protein